MNAAAQYDADGDAVMRSVHQPVFEFIKAPKLEDWSHDALVQWQKRRRQYDDRVCQRCLESGERVHVVLVPVKATIEPKLLEVVCLYELRRSVEDATSDELTALIEEKTGNVKNDQVPDLDAFFRQHLRVDLAEDDIETSAL